MDNSKFPQLIEEFSLYEDELKNIAASFRYDLECGLKDTGESSLRMLKSYIGLPEGKEQGDFLALDFGGTNLRVILIRLLGNGQYKVLKKVAKPLVSPGNYNFINAEAEATELFDFIADMVGEAIEGNTTREYLLGHTFSFPSEQTNIYNARLIIWTKEFATKGVEGEVVNDLLTAALARKQLSNVKPTAVINDTVAVLLAAAYKQAGVGIGSIYATGHNTCYYEPAGLIDAPPMIINLESGGFNKLGINSLDYELDKNSEKPYEQRLEKMVSGRYMGELFTLALSKVWDLDIKEGFTSIDLSTILGDESDELGAVQKLLANKLPGEFTVEEANWVKALAETIAERSAKLVVATYVGILWHLYPVDSIPEQRIAVDGSVFEKMPHIQNYMHKALGILLQDNVQEVSLVLENGGSALGAALAAAMNPIE